MTFRAKVRDHLLAQPAVQNLLQGRLHSLRAPNAISPYGVLSVQTHGNQNTLRGLSNLENARVRVDLYGDNYNQLVTLSEAVIDAMDVATTFSAIYIFGTELYEDDTRFFHLVRDFSVWNYR